LTLTKSRINARVNNPMTEFKYNKTPYPGNTMPPTLKASNLSGS
jgi:hypothetical protein